MNEGIPPSIMCYSTSPITKGQKDSVLLLNGRLNCHWRMLEKKNEWIRAIERNNPGDCRLFCTCPLPGSVSSLFYYCNLVTVTVNDIHNYFGSWAIHPFTVWAKCQNNICSYSGILKVVLDYLVDVWRCLK